MRFELALCALVTLTSCNEPPPPNTPAPEPTPAREAVDPCTAAPLTTTPTAPIHPATGGRCLLDTNNHPVHLLGDTAWSLISTPSLEDARHYLRTRKSQGFNAVLVRLIERDATTRQPFESDAPFAKPRDDYFDHAVQVIDAAAEAQLLVFLAPAYLGADGDPAGWFDTLSQAGTQAARDYGAYLARRFGQRSHIIWVHGGDRLPGAASAAADAIASTLHAAHPDQLHTAHSARGRSAQQDFMRPWLGFNSASGDCRTLVRILRRDGRRVRERPTVFLFGRHEGEELSSPRCLLTQQWAPLLSGASGTFTGNVAVARFAKGWREALESRSSRGTQSMARMLATHPTQQPTPLTLSSRGPIGAQGPSGLIVYDPQQATLPPALAQLGAGGSPTWWPLLGGDGRSAQSMQPPGEGGPWLWISAAAAPEKR